MAVTEDGTCIGVSTFLGSMAPRVPHSELTSSNWAPNPRRISIRIWKDELKATKSPMEGAQQQVCKVCSEILVSTCLTSKPKAMKIGPWLPGLEVGMDLGRDPWDPDMDLLQVVAGTAALARCNGSHKHDKSVRNFQTWLVCLPSRGGGLAPGGLQEAPKIRSDI